MSADMSYAVDAILIAVGTELSSGQVCNTNTAWMAQALSTAGADNILHWTVADDRLLLQNLLQQAIQHSPLVILTGGLGPTSDDFTREIIADVLQQPLVLNTASWKRLQARAQKMNFALTPSQQQQCWFPAQAEVLPNPAGTADGFVCKLEQGCIMALPGPPREVQAVWSLAERHCKLWLPEQAARELHCWQCLGVSEGALGEAVDTALAESGFETGYRAHFPYIEVKVWTPPGALNTAWRERIEAAMAPGYILVGAQDPAEHFWQSLPADTSLEIIDSVSGGQLAQRLTKGWPDPDRQQELRLHTLFPPQASLPQRQLALQLGLCPQPDGEGVVISLQNTSQTLQRTVLPVMKRRRELQAGYFSEWALLTWKEFLNATYP